MAIKKRRRKKEKLDHGSQLHKQFSELLYEMFIVLLTTQQIRVHKNDA
jgi:hypothetical protein